MYMRIVRAQPAQGQADEVARKWEAFWPEKMKAQPGFRHAYFGIDRATGAIAGVTVFDQEPDAAVLNPLLEEFRATLGASGPVQPLSDREREVLQLLAEGLTQREIARSLVITPKTCGKHIERILEKLSVHSRAQAVALAYRDDLVAVPR